MPLQRGRAEPAVLAPGGGPAPARRESRGSSGQAGVKKNPAPPEVDASAAQRVHGSGSPGVGARQSGGGGGGPETRSPWLPPSGSTIRRVERVFSANEVLWLSRLGPGDTRVAEQRSFPRLRLKRWPRDQGSGGRPKRRSARRSGAELPAKREIQPPGDRRGLCRKRGTPSWHRGSAQISAGVGTSGRIAEEKAKCGRAGVAPPALP